MERRTCPNIELTWRQCTHIICLYIVPVGAFQQLQRSSSLVYVSQYNTNVKTVNTYIVVYVFQYNTNMRTMCVRVCVRAWLRACVRAWVCVCVCVCVCVWRALTHKLALTFLSYASLTLTAAYCLSSPIKSAHNTFLIRVQVAVQVRHAAHKLKLIASYACVPGAMSRALYGFAAKQTIREKYAPPLSYCSSCYQSVLWFK